MPPSTATGGPSRRVKPIVPAIPLPLTKPRPKPKSAAIDQSTTQENVLNGTSAESHGEDVISQPAVNGSSRDESKALSTSDARGMANGGSDNGAVTAPAVNGERETLSGSATISTATTSTSSSRPPAGRGSVRPIRTELPPAFVPSAGQHTPQSATSSSHSRPPAFLPHGHSVRPSASSIVFGTLGSQHSSPAPSQSAGSVYTPPQLGQAGAPPSSMGVSDGMTPASEYTESGANSVIAPASSSSHHHFRQQHGPGPQSSHFRGPSRTQYGGQDFHAAGGGQLPNGHPIDPRAASYGSSVAPDARFNAHAPPYAPAEMGWDAQRSDMYDFKGIQHAQMPYRGGLPPFGPPMPSQSHNLHPDSVARQDNAEALRDYIHSQFANPALSDCRLQILERPEAEPQLFDGHSIILGRSPTLLSLIQEQRQETRQSNITLSIHLSGLFITRRALMDALRYLYGGPVLQWEQMTANSASEQLAATSARMELALQHIAVGAWLKIPAFAARGLEVASQSLRWDNVDSALRLALEGGLSHIWTIGDGSEEKPGESHLLPSAGSSSPTYDPFSTDLLQRIMAFTTNNFPLNFYLDPTAPELPSCPRLPATPSPITDGPNGDGITSPVTSHHRSRPSLGGSDPRLSQIRFGDVGPLHSQHPQQSNHQHHPSGTSEDLLHQRHSLPITAASSILLSLPFPILKCILEHFDLANRLGPDTVASIMRQVIAERETRRTKVVRARGFTGTDVEPPRSGSKDDSGAGAESGNVSALLSNLKWEEFVQPAPAHRAGFRIARRWVGGGEMVGAAANGAAAAGFGGT